MDELSTTYPHGGAKSNGGFRTVAARLFGAQAERRRRDEEQRHVTLRHFEFAVMTAISTLGKQAFPAEITRNLSRVLEKHVALAQVFIALERLEDKGFVSSRVSDPEPVRGGRRRRIFQIEASGLQAIRNTTAATNERMPRSEQNEEIGCNAGTLTRGPEPSPT